MYRVWLICILAFIHSTTYGQAVQKNSSQKDEDMEALRLEQDKESEEMRVASSKSIRKFHDVLDELLAEFGHDIKIGQIKGLDNLSLRKVEVSEALPHSYKKYLKLLATERIMSNAQVRVINCIACEGKTSRMVEGKIVITSPATNITELQGAARSLGITHFMDLVLVYHTTHMVLGVQVFSIANNELVWTRTYNSETIKSRFQKLAVDYSQVAKARVSEEYVPEYRILVGAGGAMMPNVNGTYSTMLTAEARSTERFNNRKSEFGMSLGVYTATDNFLTSYPTFEGTSKENASEEDSSISEKQGLKPFSFGLSIFALYVHNFLGSVESYNDIRHGVHAGIGGFLSSGYLTTSIRFGWDVFFGRKFSVGLSGLYLSSSKILVGNEFYAVKGGQGVSLVISYNH